MGYKSGELKMTKVVSSHKFIMNVIKEAEDKIDEINNLIEKIKSV